MELRSLHRHLHIAVLPKDGSTFVTILFENFDFLCSLGTSQRKKNNQSSLCQIHVAPDLFFMPILNKKKFIISEIL